LGDIFFATFNCHPNGIIILGNGSGLSPFLIRVCKFTAECLGNAATT